VIIRKKKIYAYFCHSFFIHAVGHFAGPDSTGKYERKTEDKNTFGVQKLSTDENIREMFFSC